MSLTAELDRLRILSLRDLLAHPSRHLTSVVVVAVCSALLVAVFGVTGSIIGSVGELSDDISGDVSLQVTANSSGGIPADLLKPIRRVDGVKVAAPLVVSTVPIDGQTTLLIGVDPSMVGIHSRLAETVADQERALAVMTGAAVAVGPHVPTQHDGRIEVVGHRLDAMVVDNEKLADINDGRFIVASIRVAQTLIGHPDAYDSILIVTDDEVPVSQVRSQIDAVTHRRVITSEPLVGAAKNSTVMVYMRAGTLVSASMALIVAMFFVFSMLNMGIIHRRTAFATMRTIGARQSEIRRYVLGEGLIIGLAGGLLGLPVGVLVGRRIVDNLMTEGLASAVQAHVSYRLPAFTVPLVIVVSVVSCAAAALGGVHRSARLSPIEAVGRADMRKLDEFTQPLRVSVGIVSALLFAGAIYAVLHFDNEWALIACAVCLVSGLGLCYAFAEFMVMIVARTAARLGAAGVTASLVIARARGRVWVTMMAIIIAVAVGVSGSGQINNFIYTASMLAAPLKKVPLLVSAGGIVQPQTGVLLPPDVSARIQSLPDVAKVVPEQYAFGTIDGKRVLVQGIAPGAVVFGFEGLDPATRTAFFGGDGVVISRQLVKQLGVDPGGTIVLECPTGQRAVKVLAVIDFVTMDSGLVLMPLDSLSRWYSRPGATYLEVQLRDGVDAAAAQQSVAAVLPAGVQVYTGEALYAEFMRTVGAGRYVMVALLLCLAAVVALGVFNTFLVSVIERRREIAVFGAIGASRSFIVRAVLTEAAAIGLVGGVCGTVIGLANQYVIVTMLSNVVTLHIHYRVDPMFVVYPVIAVALCMASASGAALQAARRNIVEAIADR